MNIFCYKKGTKGKQQGIIMFTRCVRKFHIMMNCNENGHCHCDEYP